MAKKTTMREEIAVELRAEAFNVLNHGQFFGPNAVNGNISSANFGQIQTASPPRLMQVAARLTFKGGKVTEGLVHRPHSQ